MQYNCLHVIKGNYRYCMLIKEILLNGSDISEASKADVCDAGDF